MEARYEDAVNEVVDLQGELRAAEAETKQLRMRLQAASAQTARTGRPAGPALGAAAAVVLPGPAGGGGAEQKRLREIGTLLEWLAEHVQLGAAEILDVGFEVPIGGRVVHLRRVAQWPMPTAPGGRLRISVPADHQESIAQLLTYIKASGGKVDASTVRRFAAVWDLVPGELATSAPGTSGASPGGSPTRGGASPASAATAAKAEPSVLLAHRGCTQGILIATWPTRVALDTVGPAAARCPVVGQLRVGDRVEVEYEGTWFSGVLQGLDAGGKANVRCDADPEGVVTVAPLRRVRRPSGAASPSASTTASPARGAVALADGRGLAASPCSAAGGAQLAGNDASSDDATPPSADASPSCGAIGGPAIASTAVVAGRAGGHRRTRSSAL